MHDFTYVGEDGQHGDRDIYTKISRVNFSLMEHLGKKNFKNIICNYHNIR